MAQRFETQSPDLKHDYAGALNVAAANGVPTTALQGFAFPSQQNVLIVTMIVLGVFGVDVADYRIWLWRDEVGGWILWDDAGTTTVQAGGGIQAQEVRGYITYADRVYVEVLNVVGAPTACKAWVFGATNRGG